MQQSIRVRASAEAPNSRIAAVAAHFPHNSSEMREDCSEAIERTPFGRCNRSVLGDRIAVAIKRQLTPLTSSGLAERHAQLK
jgi:hypothetical protein